MERIKLFAASVAGTVVLGFFALWSIRAYNHAKLNDQLSYYDALRTGIRLQCLDDNVEKTRTWEQVVLRYNETIRLRRDRNRSGFIGDYITPDNWEFVDLIAIPSEMECARIVRDSKTRQCALFMKGDWQKEFDAMGCSALLGPAYQYR